MSQLGRRCRVWTTIVAVMDTRNRLKEIRERMGISADELARRVGVSRQTVYAIEAGSYVPNTTTALLLARELNALVEELFVLGEADPREAAQAVERLGQDLHVGEPVRLCKVGRKTIAATALSESSFLPETDAVVLDAQGNEVFVRAVEGVEPERRAMIAGCDPGLSLLARVLRSSNVEVVVTSASSSQSLQYLRDGLVHVAGTHLRDANSGEYNMPLLRKLFPKTALHVATFASWQEGLVVQAGNPKAIRSVADLARRNIVIVNRQEGAGSRQLLDRSLKESGIPPTRLKGYDRILPGHIPAAAAVARGDADCCIATESVARMFGLHFIPLAAERFDLVTLRKYLGLGPVRAIFDTLTRSVVRQKLQAIAGYDVSQTGSQRS